MITAIAVAAVCTTSCNRGKQFYPVHGKLLVNGKPAEGVNIVLYLIDDQDAKPLQPSASVQADGTFEVKTYIVQDRCVKEGAPAGKYQVSCVWYPADLQKYLNAGAALPDRLHGKYADPKASGLTAEVHEQPTDLPTFELTVPAS
jgi:hypothetical protein